MSNMAKPMVFAGQKAIKAKSMAGGCQVVNGVTYCDIKYVTTQHSWQLQDVDASNKLLGVKYAQVKDNRRATVKNITTLLQPKNAPAAIVTKG